jgi:hypothetical protein
MRCAAAAVAYSRRENRLMEEYGMWMLEWTDTVFGVTLREEYGFGHKRLQRFFDESRGGLTEMVADYTPERVYEDNGKGRRKGDERARLTDGIETTQTVLDRELRAIGFTDWELVALVPEDRFDAAKIYRDKKLRTAAHSARLAWYTVNGKRALKIYVASTLLYLRDEYKLGAGRLERLYNIIAPKIRGYLESFLIADLAEDVRMKKQLDELHAVLELHGIEMVEMPDEDSVMIRAGASDKPVKAAAVGGIALVADFGGESAPEILFERESVSRNTAESGAAREEVAGDAVECVGITNRGAYTGEITETLRAESHGALPMVGR